MPENEVQLAEFRDSGKFSHKLATNLAGHCRKFLTIWIFGSNLQVDVEPFIHVVEPDHVTQQVIMWLTAGDRDNQWIFIWW